MRQEIIVTGKDVAEAVANARKLLAKDDIETEICWEVLETGSKGIFGIIGVKPAKIKAYIKSDEPEEAPARAERRREDRAPRKEGEGRRNRRGSNGRNRNNRANDTVPAGTELPKKAAVIKKPAVPEVELKMERVEIVEGEDLSVEFLRHLIDNLGIEVTLELYKCEDGTRRIILGGKDAGSLIGHHGETLDALQYLSNLACAHKNAKGERDHSRVTLDVEGYRAKREETLRALARAKAAKALRNGRNVMLEPMNAYERRIIHSEIQSIEGVSTSSIGADSNRKVVIYLTSDEEPTQEAVDTADIEEEI